MTKKINIALSAVLLSGSIVFANDHGHGTVADDVIAKQRAALAKNTKCNNMPGCTI